MLVEEAMLVMGLRLLLVCDSEEEYEIGESGEDVEGARDECPNKNKNLRLTEVKHECRGHHTLVNIIFKMSQ